MRTKIFSGDHRVTSPYGWRTIFGKRQFHNGTDFSMVTGTELLVPDTFNGAKVRLAQSDKHGGKYIQLRRSDGKGCYYLHVSAFKKKVGNTVKTGDVIALSGNTGLSTGAHTHFGVQRVATTWTSHENPIPYITIPNYKAGDKLLMLDNMNLRSSTFKVVGIAKKGSVCKVVKFYKTNNGYDYYQVEFSDRDGYIANTNFNKITTKAVTNLDGSRPNTCEDEIVRLEKGIKMLEATVGCLKMDVAKWQSQVLEMEEENKKLEMYKEYFDKLSVLVETKI